MNQNETKNRAANSTGRQLALNLMTALSVAGPARNDGHAGPLRSVTVQQKTGIARSTLRALKNTSAEQMANPDLHTLCRLADVLNIPVAFLLMRPQDWHALLRAINGMPDMLKAAESLVGQHNFGGPELAEKVLKACRVHPEYPPLGASAAPQNLIHLEDRNEWRRRTSHVLAAMIQPAARDRAAHVALTALTASFVNQTTPNTPNAGAQDAAI